MFCNALALQIISHKNSHTNSSQTAHLIVVIEEKVPQTKSEGGIFDRIIAYRSEEDIDASAQALTEQDSEGARACRSSSEGNAVLSTKSSSH